MAQIKVNVALSNPKAIHAYRNGLWDKKKVGFIRHQGIWQPFIKYEQWLYDAGFQVVSFKGFPTSGGRVSFNADNITMTAQNEDQNWGGQSQLQTVSPVNISEYTSLCFELTYTESFGYNPNNPVLKLGITKIDGNTGYESFHETRVFDGMRVIKVDITNASGDYYVAAYNLARGNREQTQGNARIFKIWLE